MRARNSGIRLNESDAAVIKAMIRRGDRQHDIAAWFGVNSGRVAEISTGKMSIGVQKGPPIGVQKGPPSSSSVTGMTGAPFALVAA